MKPIRDRNAPIVMCRRCQNEILPQIKLPGWHRDVLRKAANGMLTPVDEKAERARNRRDKGKTIRTALATRDWGTIKLIIKDMRPIVAEVPSEECDRCLKILGRAA